MRIHRWVVSLCLTAALGAPAVIVAANMDFHWDEHANQAWRHNRPD
jgi:hypothetical protein